MEDLNQLMILRREKLKKLNEMGIEPYPHAFEKSHFSDDIKNNFQILENKSVSVSGRIMSVRLMGKAAFCHLQDQNGKIQVYVRNDQIKENQFEVFKMLDIGDVLGVGGEVFKTKTGEISVLAKDIKLLSKSIRPLPIVKEKIEENERIVYDQFSDIEMRYRQRYVDLIVNPEVRDVFIKRSKIISAMRQFLEENEFLEVETPILQPIYGGAAARPFVTHHNTLDIEMYLRIANELYLKRLIVGGYDRVYEFAKDFRNEGMDRFHNPEFSMLEMYVAYKDYIWMMDFFEKMIINVSNTVFETTEIEFQGTKIDLSPPWRRMTMFNSIKEYTGIDISNLDENGVRETAEKLKLNVDNSMGYGKLVDEIFSEFVEPELIQPTFIIDYPVEMSPLAKKHRNNPKLTERFEPFIGGREVGNAFTELNDPLDQRERFMEQMKLRERGDEEAHALDEDYLRALEYGMPPTAGLGVGIDRLVMLFTDSASIRDVIFFPQMKPEGL